MEMEEVMVVVQEVAVVKIVQVIRMVLVMVLVLEVSLDTPEENQLEE